MSAKVGISSQQLEWWASIRNEEGHAAGLGKAAELLERWLAADDDVRVEAVIAEIRGRQAELEKKAAESRDALKTWQARQDAVRPPVRLRDVLAGAIRGAVAVLERR